MDSYGYQCGERAAKADQEDGYKTYDLVRALLASSVFGEAHMDEDGWSQEQARKEVQWWIIGYAQAYGI